ncbi:MAG: RdgB/HAM1 family non-canonical purine NTP pyrophosphatase [Clostridia bacterium]|nr:RdgB/HAM1 family non-canonical purine NTP pyrophosphatase [Clostridia bacterium]
MNFVIASNNQKKVEELERILKPLNVRAKTAAELGVKLDDVEETGETFKENAEIKAVAAMKKTGKPAIADDSGLMVDALGGRPGVFSARYADTDEEKIEKLLQELMETGSEDRTAHFVCVICCCFPSGEKIFAYGQCDGNIGYAPRGNNGFGYDPIFFVEGNKTFAELTETQKDAMSHRGKALKELSDQLLNKFSK